MFRVALTPAQQPSLNDLEPERRPLGARLANRPGVAAGDLSGLEACPGAPSRLLYAIAHRHLASGRLRSGDATGSQSTLLPGSSSARTMHASELRGLSGLTCDRIQGLRRIRDLRFEVLGAYVGVGTLVINYQNQKGGLVNEVLIFEGQVVTQGHGTYLGDNANLAGVASPPPHPTPG